MRAVTINAFGGPDELVVADRETPSPGPGEALVNVEAAGVNFIDVYHRTGRYPNDLPLVIGSEAAGTVREVGDGVTDVAPGDRVAWVLVLGAYAEQAVVPVERLVPVPAAVDPQTAAGALLQGLTTHYLTTSTYHVRHGDTVLVHAAAGGMGLLLTQRCAQLGARVIGTASTAAKADLARAAGAEIVVPYDQAGEAVREATGGTGVAVVYDGVGRDTFDASLGAVRTRGTLAVYGAASGPVPPVDVMRLSAAGSVFLTRPTLAHFVADRAELLARSADLFEWLVAGTLDIRVTGRYPLDRAADAHRDLEGRRTTGKLLLVP